MSLTGPEPQTGDISVTELTGPRAVPPDVSVTLVARAETITLATGRRFGDTR